MSSTSTGKQEYRVGLVLVPGFSYFGLAACIEPMFIANWLSGRRLFEWSTLSADGLAVAASSEVHFPVDFPLGTTHLFQTVLVIASFDARKGAEDTRLINWLRWAERTGAEIGAIETGSEILAAAGMVDGQTVPIHWYNIEGVQERHPGIKVSETLYNLSPRRPISAGATATLDMMIGLVGRVAGQELADEVAQHLLVHRRSGGERQNFPEKPRNDPAQADPVTRACQIMAAAIDDPVSCGRIAALVGVSERQLQRLFVQRFGHGMSQNYHLLRMKRAHQLVQQTDLPITEIAIACGFNSLEVFSRAYRRAFNVPPSRDRQQSINSSVFRRVLTNGG